MKTFMPLRCRGVWTDLVAVLDLDEDDRSPYVPPLIDRADHHEACRCDPCVQARRTTTGTRHQ